MSASGYDRADDDYYREPRWFVEALLAAENMRLQYCWDPCCGGGTIPETLNAADISCVGTDLHDRPKPPDASTWWLGQRDFFTENSTIESVDTIISNPPYNRLLEFVSRALTFVPRNNGRVVVVTRLAFLEGQERKRFYEQHPPARVWVSSRRASMPPGNSSAPARNGKTAYAWLVWDNAHRGRTQLGWL